mmetsp:Transcript_144490/g.448631  ORF Transcript_144490/g.448631 Transcript_144490/m.448631 type:complete len:297 (-) Transcript_144490:550-1440(-)
MVASGRSSAAATRGGSSCGPRRTSAPRRSGSACPQVPSSGSWCSRTGASASCCWRAPGPRPAGSASTSAARIWRSGPRGVRRRAPSRRGRRRRRTRRLHVLPRGQLCRRPSRRSPPSPKAAPLLRRSPRRRSQWLRPPATWWRRCSTSSTMAGTPSSTCTSVTTAVSRRTGSSSIARSRSSTAAPRLAPSPWICTESCSPRTPHHCRLTTSTSVPRGSGASTTRRCGSSCSESPARAGSSSSTTTSATPARLSGAGVSLAMCRMPTTTTLWSPRRSACAMWRNPGGIPPLELRPAC